MKTLLAVGKVIYEGMADKAGVGTYRKVVVTQEQAFFAVWMKYIEGEDQYFALREVHSTRDAALEEAVELAMRMRAP